MRAESIGNVYKCGVSTLEMLIAWGVLMLGLTGIIGVAFGNQLVSINIRTSEEALRQAEQMTESARLDFNKVVTQSASEDIYTKKLFVKDLTMCRKEIKSRIEWSLGTLRPEFVELSSNLADITGALRLGNDCAATPPAGTWSSPQTSGTMTPAAGEQATDIDVIQKITYMSSVSASSSLPDFFIADTTDSESPTIKSSLNTGPGINALDTASNATSGTITVYAAQNRTTSQLQIIDATNPIAPTVVASANLAGAVGANSEGRAIFYYNNRVYIGTNYLPSISAARPEFHIFDVSNPTNPLELGNFDINHNIRSIVVRDNFAYLAVSDDTGEVWVLDISNPTSPIFVSKFDAVGPENATSLFLIGNILYVGREHGGAGRPDFYMLDVSDPSRITEITSRNLALKPASAEVSDIYVAGNFAFLTTSDSNNEFQVFDISNPPSSLSARVSSLDFPQSASAIDYEDNKIYASVKSSDALRIIHNP